MKITKTKQKVTKPIPPFKTLEEEANFWDTHDAIDEIDRGTVVGFHKANKTGMLTIRFDEKDLQNLRKEAFKKGIGPTTLARMWLRERLLTR
ncbi:MAG: hypothetical protein HYT06_01845 [Candidatus Levybacteria bacterium]|nr:hypothetical protein [Candidatus Levybacteria bacterium]